MLTKKLLKEAFKEDQNDDLLSNLLFDNAKLFINDLTTEVTEAEKILLIDEYIDGFISCYKKND